MKINLTISNQEAIAIRNKEKRIVVKVNEKNSKYNYSSLEKNDIIEFSSDNLGKIYTKVQEVNSYNSLEELLTMEGIRYINPSARNQEEVIAELTKENAYIASTKTDIYAIHIEYLYSESTVWEELLEKAKNVRNPRDVSGMISAGGVGAAILTKNHNIYTGVCIDTASTLGMCGERNAIANMLTNNEHEIIKLVCVDSRGNVGSPCGACREYLMQLDKNSKNIEILRNEKTKEIVRLEELIPDWWGYDRI